MDTQQELDRSSHIVQRVLRLRERIARSDAVMAVHIFPEMQPDFANTGQMGKSYQWQAWQKSDDSVYSGDTSEHRCK